MKYIIYTVIVLLLNLSTAVAKAPERVVGHPAPLASEMLNKPIKLDCGAVIREWRGAEINVAKANRLCSLAIDNFHDFVHGKGFITNPNQGFTYNVAMLPDTKAYRGLNDLRFRFSNRDARFDNVSGYTDHFIRYAFNMSDSSVPEFDTSFVHEMFHAMSHYFGLLEQYDGDDRQKLITDELMAQKFTVFLGLGY